MKNYLRLQDKPQNCISQYFKTLFQTHNNLKYKLFHDSFASFSRVKSEAEKTNQ